MANPNNGALLSSGMINSAARGAKLVISIATWAALARGMIPEQFGLFAMAMPFVQLLSLFLSQGVPWIIIQDRTLSGSAMVDLFWVNFSVGLLAALFCATLSPLVSLMYGEPRVVPIMLMLAASLPLTALGLQHWAICMKELKIARASVLDVGASAAAGGVAILCAQRYAGYEPLIILVVSREVIFTVALWLTVSWRPNLRFSFNAAKGHLSKILALVSSSFVSFVGRSADNVIIGAFVGAEALGLYALSYHFVMAPAQMVYQAFGQVTIALMGRFDHDDEEFRRNYRFAVKTICYLAAPGLVFLVVNADILVPTLFGPEWTEAISIVRLLALTAIVQAPYVTIGWVYVGDGAPQLLFKWALFSIPLTIMAFLAGLPWGVFGVAVAYLAISVALLVPGFLMLFRHSRIRWADLKEILWPSVTLVMISAGILGLGRFLLVSDKSVIVTLLSQVAVLVALYVSMAIVARRQGELLNRVIGKKNESTA